MSRTVPNHPALLRTSSGSGSHCYQLVGVGVVGGAVAVDDADADALADADELAEAEELAEAVELADAGELAVGRTGGFVFFGLPGVVVTAPGVVCDEVGDCGALLFTAAEAGVVASWTWVRPGSPVVLPSRLPLK